LLERYPKSVKVVYKNFPLSSHKFATAAAAAALAAQRQGKFWEYHDELFKHYRNLDNKRLLEIAEKLGLKMEQFNKDRQDPVILDKIKLDYEEGQSLDVRGIPALFLNGRRINNRDLKDLQSMVEERLKKAQ
jgi:protein-disulfide isomerase